MMKFNTRQDKQEPFPLNAHELRIALDVPTTVAADTFCKQLLGNICTCTYLESQPAKYNRLQTFLNIHKRFARLVEAQL